MDEWWTPLLEPDGLLLRDRALTEADPDQLLVALRSGRLRRLQRSVYLPRRLGATPARRARAAIISAGVPGAVASHATAARLHGVEVPAGHRREHVNVEREHRRRDRPDLGFHTRDLYDGEVVRRDGLPVTSVARTVADLTGVVDRLPAVWALDDALRRALTTRDEVAAVVGRWRGGAGCALARTRLDEADGLAESVLETAGRLALRDHGVPLPVAQYEVRAADGTVVARLDGAYPEHRVALEFDGADHHGLPEAVFRDRARQNVLTELGWTVLRFTWWDVVRDPAGVGERVRRTLAARAVSAV